MWLTPVQLRRRGREWGGRKTFLNFQTAAEATTNKSEGYRWLAYDLLRNTLEGHLGNQLQSDVRVDAS